MSLLEQTCHTLTFLVIKKLSHTNLEYLFFNISQCYLKNNDVMPHVKSLFSPSLPFFKTFSYCCTILSYSNVFRIHPLYILKHMTSYINAFTSHPCSSWLHHMCTSGNSFPIPELPSLALMYCKEEWNFQWLRLKITLTHMKQHIYRHASLDPTACRCWLRLH